MSKPLTVIRKLLGAWPRTAQDFHERSATYAEAEQYEAAIEDLSRALRMCAEKAGGVPDDSDVYYFHFCRGDLYMSMKEFDKARADYEEAVGKFGDDWGTLDHERAACLIELREFAAALEVFDSPDYREPDPDVLLLRARCLAGLGKVAEAREAFERSIDQAEENWGSVDEEALFHRGKFLLNQGQFDEAVADLRKALQLHAEDDRDLEPPLQPWVIEAYRLVSQAERSRGSHAAAEEAARRADQLEQAQCRHRPKSLRQVDRDIWIGAAIEVAGTMIGVSIVVWVFGPTAYAALQRALPLSPLPGWWRAVPITLLSLSVASLILLMIASRRNERPQDDEFRPQRFDA